LDDLYEQMIDKGWTKREETLAERLEYESIAIESVYESFAPTPRNIDEALGEKDLQKRYNSLVGLNNDLVVRKEREGSLDRNLLYREGWILEQLDEIRRVCASRSIVIGRGALPWN